MSDEQDKKPEATLSRRAMGKNALKLLLAGGVSAVGLMAMAKKAHAGYGACSACNCPGFTGSSYICNNCGHNYQTHW